MIRNRYRRIVFFFARLIVSFFLWDLTLPRLGFGKWSRQTRPERMRRGAQSFRALAVDMGGVMIKVGQFLSTRVDVLPVEVTDELADLQDEVPPESFERIRQVAENDFGMPLESKFATFEPIPLAAASLGQVHHATIRFKTASVSENGGVISLAGGAVLENLYSPDEGGTVDVVVKVQRPEIETLIATDLAALRTVGGWLQRYGPIRRRVDIPALLAEFTKILSEEIDYLSEGRNAETFATNFRDDPWVRVPKVIWSHTTRRALTLQNVMSIKISDYTAITEVGISRSEVASRLLDTYLKQIFEDGFFHADPHPGNLFVYPCPDGITEVAPVWQLTFIDFGMVGRISPQLRQGLREMLIAVGTRDAARLVRSYQTVGLLLPSADLKLIERAEEKAFERFWGKNMSELQQINPQEVLQLASEFRELLYTLPFQIPHDVIFLGRTVGILSGMCTGLDPQFNVWEHLAPYAQKLISDDIRSNREVWVDELKALARSLLTVPVKMDAILAKVERGDVEVRAPEVVQRVDRLERTMRQIVAAILFMALLLGGVELFLAGRERFGWAFFITAGLCLVWILLFSRRGHY